MLQIKCKPSRLELKMRFIILCVFVFGSILTAANVGAEAYRVEKLAGKQVSEGLPGLSNKSDNSALVDSGLDLDSDNKKPESNKNRKNSSKNNNECTLKPLWSRLVIPESGFKDLDDDDKLRNSCSVEHDWETYQQNNNKFFMGVQGPSGSGRYWNITIGLGQLKDKKPKRGICFVVSTLGWRTLQKFRRLNWLEDLDGDLKPELIIWNSFYLDDTLQPLRTGISAWVYSIYADQLILNTELTRKLSLELSYAYLKPIPRLNANLYNSRHQISRVLKSMGSTKCKFK